MSRIGKKPIIIPAGVDVKVEGNKFSAKGPLGVLERVFDKSISIKKEDNIVVLTPQKKGVETNALWGTYASLVKSMVEGVSKGFSKTLVVEGIGFRAQLEGKTLVMNLGFSHQIKMPAPEGIDIKVEKNKIEVSGIDKQLVGQTAATIRAYKKPEPYKGKGIRYENEIIRRKAGKKAVGSA